MKGGADDNSYPSLQLKKCNSKVKGACYNRRQSILEVFRNKEKRLIQPSFILPQNAHSHLFSHTGLILLPTGLYLLREA